MGVFRLGALSLALGWSASTATASFLLLPRQDSPCTNVHIFLAKGNNETEPGRQGKLAGAICSGLESCDYEDIHFHNPWDTLYCDAVRDGIVNGVAQITAYANRCPDSHIVVSGYSQGAQVVTDILGGGGGTFTDQCTQPANPAMDPNVSPGKNIGAVLVFGDVRHTGGQPYNVLSGSNGNSVWPRTPEMLANLDKYADRMQSYCVISDQVCASDEGPHVLEDHWSYFDLYSDMAADWVKEKLIPKDTASTTTRATVTASPTVSVLGVAMNTSSTTGDPFSFGPAASDSATSSPTGDPFSFGPAASDSATSSPTGDPFSFGVSPSDSTTSSATGDPFSFGPEPSGSATPTIESGNEAFSQQQQTHAAAVVLSVIGAFAFAFL